MNRADLRLCGVIDGDLSGLDGAGETARALRDAGCTALVYRVPPSFRVAQREAEAILSVLQGSGVGLLVQDRVDLTLAVGAGGVLLGQADMEPRTARSLLGPTGVIALAIADTSQADELFRLPADAAFIGPDDHPSAAPGFEIDHFGRVAFRAHLAAPGIAAVASTAFAHCSQEDLIGAGADGIALPAAAILRRTGAATSSPRMAIDVALAARGRL